mmetsp:Transcript_25188/g.53623  ORF Transcript_25188/g.53623 Transcript_25188/m.53623 type:complete len:539 (-) Transcript_25188:537-2153(-)|eukprot:CAMPEP_0172556906 /NCGR_PEP_ID=MMETSP1067-20121228/70007_1 /TAXON_ID=265564 ORGANISM="Thalassiosira punctigera, Strain Tpunct2005C2" /NCGR_SAMPLE_ID=MMETSP1067 /ASSEMBLY_ACC=CAM_ASM_000444 /LENGTH=538 /DNA_ID=CAMNT_0013345841 /DNA_START=300 /DNA_END=1916 /DNA_ORIENTATION=+
MASQSNATNGYDEPVRASSTHRTPDENQLSIIEEEGMNDTSTTRHESLLAKEEKVENLTEAEEVVRSLARKDSCVESTGGNKISMKVQRKVAELAAKAYKRASDSSNVLSRAMLADIALVRFDELEVGQFLGKGSFSNVHEITRISCSDVADHNDDDNESWDEDDRIEGGIRSTITAMNTTGGFAEEPAKAEDARQILTNHYERDETGTYRYAIKFLKEQVRANPQKYAVGTADLVLEGMFLASLSHPNIIKVRGLPEGGVKSLVKGSAGKNGYFLILDRLFDTLADRIYKVWDEEHRTTVGKKFGIVANKKDKEERNEHLAVRLKVAFDISAALKYLHSKNIIYRDLKPENLGFDVRGDIKLFDLGLVKELHPSEADKGGNYRLSMAGTPRYMAPECGMYQPYNLSADVYSFSMLLWEILTLTKPLKDFTYARLKDEIFIDGERPPIRKVFNKKMRSLIMDGWSQRPRSRPSIDVVYEELKSEYVKLAPATVTEEEVSHNRRRSTFVAHTMNAKSMRHLMRLNSVESNPNQLRSNGE